MDSNASKPDAPRMFALQVSGKAPKFVADGSRLILKGHNLVEAAFLEHFSSLPYTSPAYALCQFLPQYQGLRQLDAQDLSGFQAEETANERKREWLEHLRSRHAARNSVNVYMALGNFTLGLAYPNVLDIKIGGRGEKTHKVTHSVKNLGLKLNGMHKSSPHTNEEFRSKYQLNKISQEAVLMQYLAWFFYDQHAKALRIGFLSRAIAILRKLVLTLRGISEWIFVSSSICIVYDAGREDSLQVKFIDFGRSRPTGFCEQGYDEETCKGVEFVHSFLLRIRQEAPFYSGMQLAEEQGEVVPDQKLRKYGADPTSPTR